MFLIFKLAHLGGLRLGLISQFGLDDENYASIYFQRLYNEIIIIWRKKPVCVCVRVHMYAHIHFHTFFFILYCSNFLQHIYIYYFINYVPISIFILKKIIKLCAKFCFCRNSLLLLLRIFSCHNPFNFIILNHFRVNDWSKRWISKPNRKEK